MRQDPAAVFAAGHELGAQWVRTIAYVGEPGVPGRIRELHAQGFRVLLTIGGTGTNTPLPRRAEILSYLRRLPLADAYTVVNEVDISGMDPCAYRRTWLAARRLLGRRLLFGDFSPHAPLTYTAAVVRCGAFPKRLAIAEHPYQATDPLTPAARGDWGQGGIGSLGSATRWLRHKLGIRAEWWLDEFGYLNTGPWALSDERQAALWPRAVTAATRVHARMLGVYRPAGPTWDSRPGPLAWCVLTRRCAAPALGPEPSSVSAPPVYGGY